MCGSTPLHSFPSLRPYSFLCLLTSLSQLLPFSYWLITSAAVLSGSKWGTTCYPSRPKRCWWFRYEIACRDLVSHFVVYARSIEYPLLPTSIEIHSQLGEQLPWVNANLLASSRSKEASSSKTFWFSDTPDDSHLWRSTWEKLVHLFRQSPIRLYLQMYMCGGACT